MEKRENETEEKDEKEFYVARERKDGRRTYCKVCCAEKQTEWYQGGGKNRPKTKEMNRRANLKTRYGISHDDYLQMLDDQGGRCGICGTDKIVGGRGHWDVDHCHSTNKVRGLLCSKCNTGLGSFSDSVETLRLAIRYLEDSNE